MEGQGLANPTASPQDGDLVGLRGAWRGAVGAYGAKDFILASQGLRVGRPRGRRRPKTRVPTQASARR